jgi:mannitol/fructose-specific phosphotransferase system IIA component (Ntr-type)
LSVRRYLRPEAVRLELQTRAVPPGDLPDGFDPLSERNLNRIRDEVLEELCELFDATGGVSSRSRLYRDLQNREKKAGTAVGSGVAIPHVRTLQAREFLMCFGRSTEGLPFRAPGGEPVHLFFGMISPPYEDRVYLKVYRHLASVLLQSEYFQELMSAKDPSEVLRTLEVLS